MKQIATRVVELLDGTVSMLDWATLDPLGDEQLDGTTRAQLVVRQGTIESSIVIEILEVEPGSWAHEVCRSAHEKAARASARDHSLFAGIDWAVCIRVPPLNSAMLTFERWLLTTTGVFLYVEGSGIFLPDGRQIVEMA